MVNYLGQVHHPHIVIVAKGNYNLGSTGANLDFWIDGLSTHTCCHWIRNIRSQNHIESSNLPPYSRFFMKISDILLFDNILNSFFWCTNQRWYFGSNPEFDRRVGPSCWFRDSLCHRLCDMEFSAPFEGVSSARELIISYKSSQKSLNSCGKLQ